MKRAKLFVEENNNQCDFATIEFEANEDPVEKYMSTREAENKSPMFNREMPKSVKLDEII